MPAFYASASLLNTTPDKEEKKNDVRVKEDSNDKLPHKLKS
jgi:hypothetical protein